VCAPLGRSPVPGYYVAMAADLPLLSVEDMEAMTPNERLEAVAVRTVTNSDGVPDDVRARARAAAPPVRDTAQR
jgi:hypothetical protein